MKLRLFAPVTGLALALGVGGLRNDTFHVTPSEGIASATAPAFQEYGVTLHQQNPTAPNQIYVLFQAHRDLQTGEAAMPEVPRIQTEAYRIAEQLIRDRNVQLILTEGYVANQDYWEANQTTTAAIRERLETRILEQPTLTDAGLEDFFARNTARIDPKKLLLFNYPTLDLQGAEDQHLYQYARDMLVQVPQRPDLAPVLNCYVNPARSVYALQHVPDVINRELKAGHITSRNALVIMGYGHSPEMVRLVKEGSIHINGLPSIGLPPIDTNLNPAAKDYGFVFIKPKSMIDVTAARCGF